MTFTDRVRAARLALCALTCLSPCAPALLIASLMTRDVQGQSLAWSAPLYAQVPPWQLGPFGKRERGILASTPFMPSWDPDARSVMLLSDAGEPGIVLAGRAQIDDSFQTQPPGDATALREDRAATARRSGPGTFRDHQRVLASPEAASLFLDGDIVTIGTQVIAITTSGSSWSRSIAAIGATGGGASTGL